MSGISKIHKKKKLFVVFSVLALFSGVCLCFILFFPKHSISYYYNEINNQEKISGDTVVTDSEWELLKKCKTYTGRLSHKKTLDCIKEFYEEYTLEHGVGKSFEHLAALERKGKDFVEDCHYVSHGIGHAQLKVNSGDAAQSFATLSENLYFKNVATCGNGYFHGVIEEFAKNIKTSSDLIKTLSPLCGSTDTKFSQDCYHGVGHAAFIQLDYDLPQSLDVCDKIGPDQVLRYSCHMGVFMEMSQDFFKSQLVDEKDGKLIFRTCDPLNEVYKVPCYSQMVAFYEDIAKDPKNYSKTIQYCKQIEAPNLRMACVKFFAGKAVRSVQYEDVRGLCVDGTSSKDERIMCTAAFASRIARAIDSSKEKQYNSIVTDICKYLPFYEVSACIDLSTRRKNIIYFDPENVGVM